MQVQVLFPSYRLRGDILRLFQFWKIGKKAKCLQILVLVPAQYTRTHPFFITFCISYMSNSWLLWTTG